ncbi:glutamic acid-rich protein-like [Macrosteles quadrilineatus]|uniref:glutamic acid-rich protein-like n=1 Tax=Macrosteles quadrilineatus TaxID=74068 RepID=UPI0023E21130|nr:glutamic acid-rich protein-like [Macrosteles quadrilineatus]
MTPCFLTQLLAVCAVVYAYSNSGKGSDSDEISDKETSDTKESGIRGKQKTGKRKTGAQDKFWVPTYPGTNPLNRKKIEITNSEIERFDSSIDESISGVNRNGTKAKHKTSKTEKDLSKLPYFWSGENMSNNITVKDLASLDSSFVSVDSEIFRDEDSTDFKKNYSPFTWSNKSESSVESSIESRDHSSSSPSSEERSPESRNKNKIRKNTTPIPKKLSRKVTPVMKTMDEHRTAKMKAYDNMMYTSEEASKFTTNPIKISEESIKGPEVGSNETVLSREYYKKMVEAAVENTKRKLGYREISQIIDQTFKPIVPDSLKIDSKSSAPDIYKVNMDKISCEKIKSEEEINFETKHDQILPKVSRPDIEKNKGKGKEERVKKLAKKLVEEPKDEIIHWNLTQSELDKVYKKQREVDFPSSAYYDAWSDVLLKNRTQRKSKQRKPKTAKLSSSYERSSEDMRAWPGKNIREKADEVRKKEGKLSRKDKRKKTREMMAKTPTGKKETDNINYDDNYNNVYEDSSDVGKKQRGKKTGEDDYNGESLDYDSRLRGKGGGTKTEYDFNEYSDSPKKKSQKKHYKKDYDPKNPKQRYRMSTEGEKRHAYKESTVEDQLEKGEGGALEGDQAEEEGGVNETMIGGGIEQKEGEEEDLRKGKIEKDIGIGERREGRIIGMTEVEIGSEGVEGEEDGGEMIEKKEEIGEEGGEMIEENQEEGEEEEEGEEDGEVEEEVGEEEVEEEEVEEEEVEVEEEDGEEEKEEGVEGEKEEEGVDSQQPANNTQYVY